MNYSSSIVFLISLLLIGNSYGSNIQKSHLKIKSERLGSDWKLTCFSDDSQINSTVSSVQWISPSGNSVGQGPNLYLENIQPSQFGQYTCRCHIVKGSRLIKQEIHYSIVAESFKEIQTSSEFRILKTVEMMENHQFDMLCDSSESSTSRQSHWIKPDGSVVSDNNRLHIVSFKNQDQGKYICLTKKSYDSVPSVSKIFNLNIAKIDIEHYRIAIVPNPPLFRFGEKFSLDCQITPNRDNLTYEWFKNKEFISFGKFLNFESFNKNDTGIYTCKATDLGNNSASLKLEANSHQFVCNFQHYNIELTPGAGPQILIRTKQSKELHCELDVYNNHTGNDVEWYFKNTKMDEDSLEKLGLTRFDKKWTSILVIEEANLNNEGEYSCKVANTKKSVNIFVMPEPGFVYVSPEKVEVAKGADVEFHCRIDGIENMINKNIKWTFVSKNGTEVALPNSRWKVSNPCTVSRTSFVATNSTSMEDNGYLVCTASNGKQSKGELIVKGPKKLNKVVATPSVLSVYRNQKFEFECYSSDINGNPAGKPEVRFLNGSDVQHDSRFLNSDIGPSRIRVEAPEGVDIKEKDFNMTCEYDGSKAPVKIQIKTICPPNQRSCKNEECTDAANFCNGVNDCSDGSDEDSDQCYECDPIRKPCGAFNGTNYSSIQHYSINWACDGENDCRNGFDEENCPNSDNPCFPRFFTCNDNTKIPYGYVCDGRDDCSDNEDELVCVKPEILRTSENKIRAKIGSTVTMTCEATGYPLPKIAWRYNWGCTRETERITVNEASKNCKSVISTLTIKDMQPGDDAIYGCEALSGSSRVFGNDFFVTLN